MKFLVDECMGKSVFNFLKEKSYDTLFVRNEFRGASDDWVLEKAFLENRILITCDKDFGDMIFRDQKKHKGIILLRLQDESVQNKILLIDSLLKNYKDEIKSNFIILSDKNIRIIEST